MVLRFVIAGLALIFGSTLSIAEESILGEKLRSAATKALDQIQQSQATAIRKENCASCHHQLLPEMALSLAPHRVKWDSKAARQSTLQTFGFLKDLDVNVQGNFYIDVMFESSLLVAAHQAGIKPNLSTDALAQFIAGRQLPDGSWRIMDTRPPQSKSRFTVTANCAKAMFEYLPESMNDEKLARLGKARAWLLKATSHNTEDRVYQLLGLLWTGADLFERKKAAEALLAEQRADGGWAQLPSRDSDSYATGSVLSALHVAAGLPTRDPVYQRGLKFLLKTQKEDGTWHIATRLHKPAPISPPFASTGFPYGKDQFISLFGTTWAVTAILHALPALMQDNVPYKYRELAPDANYEWVQVALNGTAADLKKLLDAGLDPNSKTPAGTTALMMAVRDPAKVKLLLERGADAKARAKSGFDALMVASRFHGSAETVKTLLKAGAKPNPEPGVQVMFDASPIFFAAASGDKDVAAALLDAGAKLNQRMKMLGKIGTSPLQYAVTTGDAAMVELLLKRGGNANESDPDDQISLVGWAAITNSVDVLDVLLARGAKVDHKDSYGMTPLLFAASIDYGDTVVIEKLLAGGANDKATTNGGKTASDLAKGYKHNAIAERLAKKSSGR